MTTRNGNMTGVKKLYGLPTLAACLTAFVAWAVYRSLHFPGEQALIWRVPLDLDIYRMAGQDLVAGGLLYDAPYIWELPFTYPPFAGVVFETLAHTSNNLLIALWQGGTMLALLAVVLLVLHNRGVKLTPLTAYVAVMATASFIALEPIHGTLFYGQINVFLMLLVSLDLIPRRRRLPGIGIGLAAGLKLTPAFLGLVLLFQKRWWAALGSVLTFAATVAVGFWLIPDAKDFWTNAMFNSSRIGDRSNGGSLDALSLMSRLYGTESRGIWLIVVAVVVALTCWAVWVAVRRDNSAAALTFTGISACVISPFSWYHHFVWVTPLAILILVATNQFCGRLLERPLGARVGGQLAGLASFVLTAALMIPWVAGQVWYAGSFRNLNDWLTLQPWATLLYSGAGVLYMLVYAIYGTVRPAVRRSTAPSAPDAVVDSMVDPMVDPVADEQP